MNLSDSCYFLMGLNFILNICSFLIVSKFILFKYFLVFLNLLCNLFFNSLEVVFYPFILSCLILWGKKLVYLEQLKVFFNQHPSEFQIIMSYYEIPCYL